MKIFQETYLERQVSGALKCAIKAHGPIDGDLIGSAAKRVATSIRGQLLAEIEEIQEEGPAQLIKKYKRENDNLAKKNKILARTADYWRKKSLMDEKVFEAHSHCKNNRAEIEASETAACFHCTSIYCSTDVVEWIGLTPEEATAVCPNCGIDAVIGDKAGFRLTMPLLGAMRSYWFSSNSDDTEAPVDLGLTYP